MSTPLTQRERERMAVQHNVLELRADVLRGDAARMDLEAKCIEAQLQGAKWQEELGKTDAAIARKREELLKLEAKLKTYDPPTLVT